jgi:hypothetical protein
LCTHLRLSHEPINEDRTDTVESAFTCPLASYI